MAKDINQQLLANGRTDPDNLNLARTIVLSGTTGNLVAPQPYIKYPIDKAAEYKNNYPKFTEYLRNKLPNVANISQITDGLQEFTGLSLEDIQKNLEWGEGPELHIVQLDNFCDTCSEDTAGHYDDENPDRKNKIYVDVDLVNKLENNSVTDVDAFVFFLGVNVLHEFVHWGEHINPNPDFFIWGEEGEKFEIKVYGYNVQEENARFILNRLNN